MHQSAQCAYNPVSGFIYRAAKNSDAYRIDKSNIEAIWNSKRRRSVNDITLCTQFDSSRMYMLEGQCKAWGGPISAAVYLPKIYLEPETNEESLESLKSELTALHNKIEANEDCILDIVLLSEFRMADEAWSYPYNTNRNHAMSRAKTRLMLLLDVDFVTNQGLRKAMLEPAAWSAAIEATYIKNHVLVLPAFETNSTLTQEEGLAVAYQTASAASKQDIVSSFREKKITQFAPFFQRGHGATDYSRWFATPRGVYPVHPNVGYEPFIILSRLHAPYFDERFRGYGWDKIVHIQHLLSSGFKFMVQPNAWVVHRPHPPSQGYSKSFTGPVYQRGHKPTEELKKLDVIAKEMLSLLKKGKGNGYPQFGVTNLVGCHPLEILKKKVHRQQ